MTTTPRKIQTIKNVGDPSTATIKTHLVQMFPDTKVSSWKRTKKYSEENAIIRQFQHQKLFATALYRISERTVYISEDGNVPFHIEPLSKILDKPESFFEDDEEEDVVDYQFLTGKLCMFKHNEDLSDFEKTGEYAFYLGPENRINGRLCVNDSLSVNNWLEETLDEWMEENGVSIEFAAAENFHILNPGHTSKIRLQALLDDMIATIRQHLPEGLILNDYDL